MPEDQVACVVIPRSDASSDQLKQLGKALEVWCEKEQEAGLGALYDSRAVIDLQAGELPQPLAIRHARKPTQLTEDSQRLVDERGGFQELSQEDHLKLQFEEPSLARGDLDVTRSELGEFASSRAFGIAVSPIPPGGRARVIRGLSQYVPRELVDDIVVVGKSWSLND